jgi:DNA-binding NarL/FixJ family response regulator
MHDEAETKPVRLVLLDDHGLFRESLGHLLASEPDLEVAGLCSTYSEGLDLLARGNVDLVLLDLMVESKRSDGFVAAARLAGYQGRFLIVTAVIDAVRSITALKNGASGIFLKSNSSRRLLQAVRLVASGEAWLDQTVVDMIAERYPCRKQENLQDLSALEQTVLNGLLKGLTSREIGVLAGISESHVKAVVQQLFDKAGVRKRSQLVRVVLEGSLGDWLPEEAKINHPHVIF